MILITATIIIVVLRYASSSMLSVFVKDSISKENVSAAVTQWSCNAIYFIARGQRKVDYDWVVVMMVMRY